MRGSIKEYYIRFKSNKLFKTTMRSYFVISFIVLLTYAFVMIANVYHAAIKQVTTAEQKMLAQAETTYDFVLRNVIRTANNVIEDHPEILKTVSMPYDPVNSVRITEFVTKTKNQLSAIDGIYFFNLKDDCIYTSDHPVFTAADFPDQELLSLVTAAKKYDPNRPHVLKYYDGNDLIEKNVLVSLFKYSPTGCMAVFIDSDQLNSMINATLENNNQRMTVINSSGIVLSSTEQYLFGQDLSDEYVVKSFMASNKRSGYKNIRGTICCFRKSVTYNSLYICSFRSSSVVVSFIWQIMAIILFAILLAILYLISSIKLSVSIFRPYIDLRSEVYSILKLDPDGNNDDQGTKQDLDAIATKLEKIKSEKDSLQHAENLYLETRLNELVYSIVTGAFNYDKQELIENNIVFPFSYNTVALVRIDNTNAIERSSIDLIRYGLANIGKELLNKDDILTYTTTYSNEYDVVFLINHKNAEFSETLLEMVRKFASLVFNVSVSAAYDTTDSRPGSVAQLYSNVNIAMQYRLIYGHGSIIRYDDISGKFAKDVEYPSKIEKKVIHAIDLKSNTDAENAVDEFLSDVYDMPYGYIITYTSYLLTTIASTIKTDRDDIPHDMITNAFSKAETLDEIRNELMAKCNDAIISSSDTNYNDKQMIMASAIEDYINENYTNHELSIGMISSHINKSDNYTRAIFKNAKGISISNYILNKRFDEACRLLLETNLTAQAIAVKIGMSSGSYFYAAFKRYTGLTPEQYRKNQTRSH